MQLNLASQLNPLYKPPVSRFVPHPPRQDNTNHIRTPERRCGPFVAEYESSDPKATPPEGGEMGRRNSRIKAGHHKWRPRRGQNAERKCRLGSKTPNL